MSTVEIDHDADTASKQHPFSYFRLIVFSLTACANWFAEPILSLADTIVVGRVSTLQLAALGPATIVFDAAVFLCYFLAIANTNLLATAIAKKDEFEQKNIISQSLGVAILLGLITIAFIFGFGHAIIGWLAGKANLEIVNDAMAYAKIRVLESPAAIVGMVCQATSLAYLDTFTPALAVITATAINLMGNYLLCIVGNFGIQGAAIATVIAQLVSCAILLKSTRDRFRRLDNSYAGNTEGTPLISLPDKAAFLRLVKLGGPIFFVIVGEIACQFVITFRATTCGILSLATHNIVLRLYLFFATFGDGLSHTAQVFLPRLLHRKEESDKISATQSVGIKRMHLISLFRRLGVLAGIVVLVCSTAAFVLVSQKGTLLTASPSIVKIMESTSPWMFAIFLLQPFNLLYEGIAIASNDFNFLVGMYGTSIVFLVGQTHFCASLADVWRSFFMFQVIRFVQFFVRSKSTMLRIAPTVITRDN